MIGLNRHWQAVKWRDDELPLVVHYAGCSFCAPPTDKITEKAVSACNLEFMRAFALAKCEQRAVFTSGRLAGSSLQHTEAEGAERACRYYDANVLARTDLPALDDAGRTAL